MSQFNSFEAIPQGLMKKLTQPTTYVLCNIKDEDVFDFNTRTTTRRKIIPTSYYIDPTYGYVDKNGNGYTFRYMIGSKTVKLENGGEMIVPVIGNINFQRKSLGQITVDPNRALDHILYNILEFHPKNEANGGSVFRKLDYETAAKEESRKTKDEYAALEKCFKMNEKDLNATCKGFLLTFNGVPIDKVGEDEKRTALIKIAKNDPVHFIEKLKGLSFAYISVIRDAELLDIISFNTVKDSWVYNLSGDILHHKMPALDKYESLVEWIRQNNKGEIAFEKLKTDIAEKNKK